MSNPTPALQEQALPLQIKEDNKEKISEEEEERRKKEEPLLLLAQLQALRATARERRWGFPSAVQQRRWGFPSAAWQRHQVALVAVILWCILQKKSLPWSHLEVNLTKNKGNEEPDAKPQVNETSSKEKAEIILEELKCFYEICQKEKISPDETFKKIEEEILAQRDPKLYITEQLNVEKRKIQNDLEKTNKELLKIQEEIVKTGSKALRNARKVIENKRKELEEKRDALEIEENLVNVLKEIISNPTIDPKPMIHLCNTKIGEMSAAHKTQEKEAFEWVKTVLVRKFQ